MLLRFISFPPLLLKSETYFLEMKYKYSLTYIHCITDDDGDDVFFRTFEQIIKFPCTMFKFKCDYKFSGGVSLPLLRHVDFINRIPFQLFLEVFFSIL